MNIKILIALLVFATFAVGCLDTDVPGYFYQPQDQPSVEAAPDPPPAQQDDPTRLAEPVHPASMGEPRLDPVEVPARTPSPTWRGVPPLREVAEPTSKPPEPPSDPPEPTDSEVPDFCVDVTCDDNNVCTTDTCDSATGCVFTPVIKSCDDGNACTEGDMCNTDGVCAGAAVTCNDNSLCTTDTCDSATGCVFTPSVTCHDGNVCTNDICVPATGACIFPVSAGTPCDDGIECTHNDACTNEGKCAGKTGEVADAACEDGNVCTVGTCDNKVGCLYEKVCDIPCKPGELIVDYLINDPQSVGIYAYSAPFGVWYKSWSYYEDASGVQWYSEQPWYDEAPGSIHADPDPETLADGFKFVFVSQVVDDFNQPVPKMVNGICCQHGGVIQESPIFIDADGIETVRCAFPSTPSGN